MSLETSFLIYSTLFRLSMIAAGAVSIFLGYRLFRVAFVVEPQGRATSVEASVAGQKFILRNAAPGTAFALFGVIIISVMAVQGSPELTVKSMGSVTDRSAEPGTEIKLRGNSRPVVSKFDDAVEKGLDYDKQGNVTSAVSAYEDALTALAMPMNQLAWDYHQQSKEQDALPLARLAVQLSPTQAAYADTLAEVLAKQGQTGEALVWMTKAAALDARYQPRVADLKRTAKQ